MNRAQRRATAKAEKINFKLLTPDTGKQPDRSKYGWCWLHPNLKVKDPDKPTEEEKKRIESVRMIPTKTRLADGTIVLGRMCRRCHNSITVQDEAQDKLEGFTTK